MGKRNRGKGNREEKETEKKKKKKKKKKRLLFMLMLHTLSVTVPPKSLPSEKMLMTYDTIFPSDQELFFLSK